MSQINLVLKQLKNLKAFLFELQAEGRLGVFDGLEWDYHTIDLQGSFENCIQQFVQQLPSNIKLKHQNDMSWRVECSFEDEDFVCAYSAQYQSLRISRAPSKKATLEDWGFTETQIKSLSQPGQIAIVTGPQGSGKGTVQKLLMRHADQAGVQARLKAPNANALAPRQWYFGDEEVFSPWSVAELSFKGQSICFSLEALDLEAALLMFFEKIPEIYRARLINHLTVIETRLLPGLEQIVVPFSSFYQLRYCPNNMIERQDWASLITWHEGQKDNFNVRTLNQVLLQGVLRRKIEMKTAFAASAHPEGLDLMLRRIGV